MIKQLSSLYDQILLSEAEKSALQGTNNKVGTVPSENLFGEKPKVTDTGKVKGEAPKNLDHKTTSPEDPEGDEAKSIASKGAVKSTVPAKSSEEAEGSKPKPKGLGEEFTMGAFETLFRKTLVTEEEVEMEEPLEFEAGSETPSEESEVEETEEEEAEEDLLTDLQDLQVRIADIITKLEKAVEEESLETSEDKGYSDEDFSEEFGEEGSEEESPVHEESLKVLGDKKKVLQSKNNKVGGKVTPKGGKAYTGKYPKASELKPLGDKSQSLKKGNTVKSSLKKGDSFIK